VNNTELEKMAKDKIPDVLLVKKVHGENNEDDLHNNSIAQLEGFPVIEPDSSEMRDLLADLMKISE